MLLPSVRETWSARTPSGLRASSHSTWRTARAVLSPRCSRSCIQASQPAPRYISATRAVSALQRRAQLVDARDAQAATRVVELQAAQQPLPAAEVALAAGVQ